MPSQLRLRLTRRIASLPLLLQEQGAITKQALTRIYKVDAKTIARDISVLIEFYPITRRKVGREVEYVYDKKKSPTLNSLRRK